MGRFTTTERRGTVALVIVLAIVVGYMALGRGSSDAVDSLPEVCVGADTGVKDASTADSVGRGRRNSKSATPTATSKKKRDAAAAKGQSTSERQRDYLNEQVNE